jgi:glutathione synthase/RimK-type ligase-like ATP-grasp enzyme
MTNSLPELLSNITPMLLQFGHSLRSGNENSKPVRVAFQAFKGAMIAKPVRTGYVDLGEEQLSIFTNAVLEEHLTDNRSISISPVIYQQHIKKASDVRVTIVGDKIFAAEIDSQSDPEAVVDWRKTVNPSLGHRRIELPKTISDLLHRLMQRLGLEFGAIDFVRTPDDRYVFLEINPNGQWLWLDDMLGLGITDEVTTWLAREKV